MSEVYIYTLCDPDTEEPRYVGQTVNMATRLNAHVNEKSGSLRATWIMGLLQQNKRPLMKVLEVVDAEVADDVERRWIQSMKANGTHLTNMRHVGEYIPAPNLSKRRTVQASPELHSLVMQIADATGMTVDRILAPLVKREHERLSKRGVIKEEKGGKDE